MVNFTLCKSTTSFRIIRLMHSASRCFENYFWFTIKTMEVTHGRSPRNVVFFQTISRLATFFGVIPYYDYKQRRVTHEQLYKRYAVALVCFVTPSSVASLCYRINNETITVNAKVLDLLVEGMGIIFYLVSVLSSSFWNMNTWHKLVNRLYRLETHLNVRPNSCISLIKSPCTLFIGGVLFSLVTYIFNSFCMEQDKFISHMTQSLFHCVKFVLVHVVYNVTLAIKSKYEDLNHMLLYASNSRNDIVRNIRKVRQLNLQLDGIVETFNTFFGWPVLFVLAHSIYQLLCCLALLTMESFGGRPYFLFVMTLYMTQDIVSIFNI